MRSLYGHRLYRIHRSKAHVLTVAFTMQKAMSLHHKFDENMKGNSKLLITEATFGFCVLCEPSCAIYKLELRL